MSQNNPGTGLQRKLPESLKEKTQYGLAFGVIAMMLWAVQFPVFVIIFFGIFAYFLWKTFSSVSPRDTRDIFEFYLSANEILRDDERRWFGFEINEVIGRGEKILQSMHGAPPLVYFALGALYSKTGDYKNAVSHLAYVVENNDSNEAMYNFPSPELRHYVTTLRRIEREPANAPQTSAAIRALERIRRNRAKTILENSRTALADAEVKKLEAIAESQKINEETSVIIENDGELIAESRRKNGFEQKVPQDRERQKAVEAKPVRRSVADLTGANDKNEEQNRHVHQPISEVLRDLYGEK